MEWFDCTDPEQLVMIGAVISIIISKNMTVDEISSFGNFLNAVGQNLQIIASQQVLNESQCSCDKNSNAETPGDITKEID